MKPAALVAVGFTGLLATCVVTFGAGVPAEMLPTAMAEIRASLDAGRGQAAEARCREVIDAHPGYADAWFELSRALELQGRIDEALATVLEPGQGLVEAGNLESGLRFLERAVELAPDDPVAQAVYGQGLMLSRDFGAATTHLRRAVALGRRDAAVHVYLGSALWESGSTDAADRHFRLALESDPRSVAALNSLGSLLVWQGDYATAIDILKRALDVDPDSAMLQLELARAYDGAGRAEDAAAAYRRTIAADPELAQPHYALAIVLRKLGDQRGASAEVETFQALHHAEERRTRDDGLSRAKLDAGWELIRAGDLAAAVAQFHSLGGSPAALSGLGAALCESGDYPGAVRALERAVLLDPDNPRLKYELSRARMGADDLR